MEQAAAALKISTAADILHIRESVARALVEAENRGIERAARLIDEGFDRPGIERKVDKCAHGLFGWDDCEQCAATAIRKLRSET
jgi:hypothetical protein